MYDTVRSSYPLGEQFTGELQTKEIEACLGGTMTTYWISPAGELFEMDYRFTQDLVPNTTSEFFPYRCEPNGNHGKVKALNLTKSVEVYPASFDGNWEDWPTKTIFFINGVITHVHESPKASP